MARNEPQSPRTFRPARRRRRGARTDAGPYSAATVLVTGGAGFVGSLTCTDLLDHGYEVIVVDDHSNSTPQVFPRVERVAGRFVGAVYQLDIRDRSALSAVFARHSVDAVVHFAAHKSEVRSTRMPVGYYDTNVGGTTALLRTMHEHGVHHLVYHSSAAVYGDAGRGPLDERTPPRPVTPYAMSKWVCERILEDVCRHCPQCTVVALRCSTPAGAHPSGLLGEDQRNAPESLLAQMALVADGRRPRLEIRGDAHPTPDGTPVRDYLHVMDAVEAHRVALDHLADGPGMTVYNLARGEGSSVRDVLSAFTAETGRPVPYEVLPAEPGAVPEIVADPTALTRAWGWRPTRDLTDVCRDTWHFQRLNPHGYRDAVPGPEAGA
ncbi:UDP-glucose 4-epimerase GalE [Streptomyces sp. SID8111]|uniref:UDP-glucose 4-epimerase GalE n=1 Tax=Streptomyces sp. SID8111 TaxID=2706100 RepID=UPI0013C0E90B|nr:UDP-glucose 4-epimerase GalE [Streptomyces sp. SID8111]NEC30063.1 UDP-glucose 4-epimerase GalE [Streptomyces sp. SID8111]